MSWALSWAPLAEFSQRLTFSAVLCLCPGDFPWFLPACLCLLVEASRAPLLNVMALLVSEDSCQSLAECFLPGVSLVTT